MENNLYLVHHGIKGQRWGVRRYQNPDGTLTPKGKNRSSSGTKNRMQERAYKRAANNFNNFRKSSAFKSMENTAVDFLKSQGYNDSKILKPSDSPEKVRKAIKDWLDTPIDDL